MVKFYFRRQYAVALDVNPKSRDLPQKTSHVTGDTQEAVITSRRLAIKSPHLTDRGLPKLGEVYSDVWSGSH